MCSNYYKLLQILNICINYYIRWILFFIGLNNFKSVEWKINWIKINDIINKNPLA